VRPAPRAASTRRGHALARRALAVAALAVATGCAAADTSHEMVADTLPDGTVVACARPPQPWFETERAAALSAAFPNLVQTLLSSASAEEKVRAMVPEAPTPELVAILGYRICLEAGKGVVPEPAYASWLRDVRPGLLRRVGGAPADTGSSGGGSRR